MNSWVKRNDDCGAFARLKASIRHDHHRRLGTGALGSGLEDSIVAGVAIILKVTLENSSLEVLHQCTCVRNVQLDYGSYSGYVDVLCTCVCAHVYHGSICMGLCG